MTATARILIVEDQHLAALDCEQELARAGFECVGIANTAAEAMLLATRQRPDLILMDVRLASRTNGIEMAKEIYDQCGIRCLFVTEQTDPDLRRDAEATRPLGWIEKPYTSTDLISAIERALQELASAKGPN